MTANQNHAEDSLPTAADIEELILLSPFHRWLGIRVREVRRDGIDLTANPDPDIVGNTEGGVVHGGILASLLDMTADWALVGTIGTAVPTIDLSVNYLRAANVNHTLHASGKLIRPGKQVSVAESEIRDDDGRLIAVGRGSFLSAVAPKNNREAPA